MTKRAAHQDANNPVCEGSGVTPLIEGSFGVTDTSENYVSCPGCGFEVGTNRDGTIRRHRREAVDA